ncbi:MAG TPA: LCP family protein [Symbiobacteriaceae bacterium]|nr:LCP family protein [Symbiobacteriaceae bacterium]
MRRLYRRRGKSSRGFWAGVALGLLLSFSGLAVWWFSPPPLAGPQGANRTPGEPATLGGPVHVLVLGVDERDQVNGSRTDTMLLLRFEDDQVRMLSIPRDTLVDMDAYGEGKINSAYTYGGPDLAKQVTSELVGVPVDHYVKVNLAGFRRLVDMMGGVQFDVPKAMRYSDPTDGLEIDLQPGLQVLNGDMAEQFIRYRYDDIGDDMGRIARQQEFLKAAARQALAPSRLTKLPQLLYTARSYVETDIPVGRQLQLAQASFAAQQRDAVVQETLPGHGDYVDGLSFYLIHQDELDRLVEAWHQS